MTDRSCSRAWEAEALDEGRLTGADRASFERHATTCAACRREVSAIASVRATLALVAPAARTPLEHQRARSRLLRAANERAFPRARRTWLLVPAVLGVLAVGLGLRALPGPSSEARGPVAEPARIDPPSAADPSAPPVGPAVEPASASVDPPRVPGRASASPAAAPTANPGVVFDEAFASFERGAYGIADLQLEHFLRSFPSDPRAEDAAYLRAVSRSRLGDREGAQVLARAYLDAFPRGLRRREAERLAAAR